MSSFERHAYSVEERIKGCKRVDDAAEAASLSDDDTSVGASEDPIARLQLWAMKRHGGIVADKIAEKTTELKEKEIQCEINSMPEFDISMPANLDALTSKSGQYGPWLTSDVLKDPWGNSYIFTNDASNKKFTIKSGGKSTSTSDDVSLSSSYQ